MSKSDYLEGKLLDHTLRNTPYTAPTTVYVGLFTTVLNDDGTGTEVSGNGYARRAITFNRTGDTASNALEILFPEATPAGWGSIVAFGLFDAISGGNQLYNGTVAPPKTISAGDVAKFAPGTLTITDN